MIYGSTVQVLRKQKLEHMEIKRYAGFIKQGNKLSNIKFSIKILL